MRFHLLAPPNVQTTHEYSLDGFGALTIRFATLLKKLGHTVILYGSEENEAPCDEFVTVITKTEQKKMLGDIPYYGVTPAASHPLWVASNIVAITDIRERKQPKDIICSIGGTAQKMIADYIPELMFLEYSVGYTGSFSQYRIYPSHVWRHYVHGFQQRIAGRHFDDVIPSFFDESKFTFRDKKEPYVAYVGRLVPDKGITVACKAAKLAGRKLLVSGFGNPALVTDGAEYLGPLNEADRNELLSKASAVICPTQYLEPFGCVAVEAQLCGTPAITSDFGAFVETVDDGVTGARCHYLGEFAKSIREAHLFNHEKIRSRAVEKYSMAPAARSYQRTFDRLNLLWADGWNTV